MSTPQADLAPATSERPAPDSSDGSAERAGELIIHRPHAASGGAARSFKVRLDGRPVAILAENATVRLPAAAGRHEVRVRCWPHAPVRLEIEVTPFQTVRLVSYLSALRELELLLERAGDRAATY